MARVSGEEPRSGPIARTAKAKPIAAVTTTVRAPAGATGRPQFSWAALKKYAAHITSAPWAKLITPAPRAMTTTPAATNAYNAPVPRLSGAYPSRLVTKARSHGERRAAYRIRRP